jgi:RNA polymerase-binding transcription factor DksA
MLRDVDPTETPEQTVTPNNVDLDRIEQDLADVETALARLEAGTYWTCEVTGSEIPDAVLATSPTARRAVGSAQG